jgi:hypothetical protein
MALRNQPYLPLYVQDYLTDEKLNNCSPSAQGIYIKIMCLFHKCDPYGGILLEQKDKQTDNICLNFAKKIAKQLPFDSSDIYAAMQELLDEKVLRINDNFLYQKRMVKDSDISTKRSGVGSKGGKKTQSKAKEFANEFAKAKSKANSENENENENENRIIKKSKFSFDFVDANFKEIFMRWIKYKTETKNNYKTQDSLQQSYENLLKMSNGSVVVANDIVNNSIGNGYKGLFKPKDYEQPNGNFGKGRNGGVSQTYRDNLLRDLQTGINEAVAKEVSQC